MDREILKYLYGFYEDGDYVGFHLLTPLFNKLYSGKEFAYFVQRLRTILSHLVVQRYIELDSTEYGSWGTLKEGSTLFDYNHLPVKGRITEEGAENIERAILADRQAKVNKSVLLTNFLTRLNILATILFGLIVTTIQVKSCNREIKLDRQVANRLSLDSLRLLQQSKHDSLFENAVLRIISAKTDSSKRKKSSSSH